MYPASSLPCCRCVVGLPGGWSVTGILATKLWLMSKMWRKQMFGKGDSNVAPWTSLHSKINASCLAVRAIHGCTFPSPLHLPRLSSPGAMLTENTLSWSLPQVSAHLHFNCCLIIPYLSNSWFRSSDILLPFRLPKVAYWTCGSYSAVMMLKASRETPISSPAHGAEPPPNTIPSSPSGGQFEKHRQLI